MRDRWIDVPLDWIKSRDLGFCPPCPYCKVEPTSPQERTDPSHVPSSTPVRPLPGAHRRRGVRVAPHSGPRGSVKACTTARRTRPSCVAPWPLQAQARSQPNSPPSPVAPVPPPLQSESYNPLPLVWHPCQRQRHPDGLQQCEPRNPPRQPEASIRRSTSMAVMPTTLATSPARRRLRRYFAQIRAIRINSTRTTAMGPRARPAAHPSIGRQFPAGE
jgi:hypothetical protein